MDLLFLQLRPRAQICTGTRPFPEGILRTHIIAAVWCVCDSETDNCLEESDRREVYVYISQYLIVT